MMGNYYNLLAGIFQKQLLHRYRYPFNTITKVATIYVLFLVVFLGGRATVGAAIDDSLDGIIAGLFLLSTATNAYSGIAWGITRESQWGTLEQLYMAPFSFGRVMLVRSLFSILEGVVIGSVVLVLMMVTTGRYPSFDLVTVSVVMAFTIASVAGIGLALGGLALIYKRIENFFSLIQWLILVLIAAPTAGPEFVVWLPVSAGSELLRATIAGGATLRTFPSADVMALVVTGVGYLLVGYVCFQFACRRAKRRGLMGQY